MTDPQNPGDATPPPYTPPPAAEPAVPQAPAYGQQPPAYGQQPPAYGEQPPAYTQQPPAYGQQPPAYTQQPYTAAPPAPYGAPASPTIPGKTMGIVAFILSFFVQLIALILGIVALVQSKKAGYKNGWAVAAIIISAVLMVIGTIIAIVVISQFAGLAAQIAEHCVPGGSGFVELWGQQVPCEGYVTTP